MTKSSYIKGKSEEMSTGEKEEREKIREKISAKLKKRIEELDKIIKELEKRKEEEEKSNPGDIDIWLAVLRSLRDEGVALSAIEERTKAVPEINNKLSTIEGQKSSLKISLALIVVFQALITNLPTGSLFLQY